MVVEDRPEVAVGVLLQRARRVLLGRRLPPAHGHGTYGAIGGRVHPGETFVRAVRRVAWEEAGVVPVLFRYICVTNVAAYGCHSTGPQVLVTAFDGEPVLREPHLVERWEWHDPEEPPQPLFKPVQLALVRLYEPCISVIDYTEE